MHHIRFSVDDFDGTIADMKQRGAEVSMQGEILKNIEGLRFPYFDTANIPNYIIEIFNEDEDLGQAKA